MITEDEPVATAPGSDFVLRRQMSWGLPLQVSNLPLPVGEGNEGKGGMARQALSLALSQWEREKPMLRETAHPSTNLRSPI